jgi:asparagine synthase (glutamine-hydrolysing)
VSAIAGLWRFDGEPDPGADCGRMLAAQEIYGPHDGRVWSDGPLALGRRLFRTLPEDIYDRQPLQSRDGRLTLVADLRIDNRDELTAALGVTRADAAQLCDAAILLACLDRWSEAALDRLVGDFAFALWDARAQTLMLARDFRGHVPLHYHRSRTFFAFASMPKGLHALADIPRAPDEDSIAEFVARIPQITSRTYFAGIERVKPAHIVTVKRDGLSSRRYWQPRRPAATRMSTNEYVEGLRFHLDQATQARLRGANGKVGTHLSAGLDSAGVTATAARLLTPSGGKVVAFTAVPREGYNEPERPRSLANEGPLAAATTAMYGNIDHVLIRSGHLSPLAGLDRSFFLCDRPIPNLCNWVWTQAINDAARARNINIVLTGQMGNTTLSYKGLDLLPELLRHGRLLRLWHEAAQLVEKREMNWRGALPLIFGPFAPMWLWQWAGQFMRAPKRDLLTSTAISAGRLAAFDFAALAQERDVDFAHRPSRDSFNARQTMIYRGDIGNYNKGILAGWGIDLRDPTADKRLVEYCLSTPTDQYLADGVPRAFAKRALADRLPQAVLSERKKGYQAADWHDGLTAARPDIVDELARLSSCAPAARSLDIERLQALVENWPASGWDRDDRVKPYRLALLRGISAGHFLRKASGENR